MRFDDFHQSTEDRKIVNVKRFKVSRCPIRSIIDFPQDIGDSIAHHPTGTRIAVHEQGSLGGKFFRGTKPGIQIHKSPVATHAHQEILTIRGPKRGSIPGVEDIRWVGDGVRVKLLDDVRSQCKPAVSVRRSIPFAGQTFFPNTLWPLDECNPPSPCSTPNPRPSSTRRWGTTWSHRPRPIWFSPPHFWLEVFQKLLSRRQQVLLGHASSKEVVFLSIMVVSFVHSVPYAYVPSDVKQRIRGCDKTFPHGRDVGYGQTDQAHLPIGPHEANGTRQPVFETMGLVVGKLVLVVLAQESHVERMRRGERHDLFFLAVVMA